jgi:uncharacterized membrane-anchored protein YhcB (DUF1043 family)
MPPRMRSTLELCERLLRQYRNIQSHMAEEAGCTKRELTWKDTKWA